MVRIFNTAQDAFEFYFDHIMREGISADGVGTLAVFNESFKMRFPNENEIDTPWRRWKKRYAEVEYEWYKTGNRQPDMVAEASIWERMKDENGLVYSNYGFFWNKNDQLKRMIELLKQDPLTRRAIISHYDINEIQKYGKDTPCNVVLNFYSYDGESLNLTIFARSIDLVYGFCNDQYCFSRLLMDIADELCMYTGEMTYMITNLHIYEKHFFINERK